MLYPPKQCKRKGPWTATVQASHLKASRYMDELRQQKLIQLKEAEERNHHSVKLQRMTMQAAKQKPQTAPSPALNGLSPREEREDSICSPKRLPSEPSVHEHRQPEGAPKSQQELPLQNADGGNASESAYKRKTTVELDQEFKHLSWANVDEFSSYKAKLEKKAQAEERLRKQVWLRNELETQLQEQKEAKNVQKKEILQSAQALLKDLELWRSQEREMQKRIHEKMLKQKEDLNAQMLERQRLQEETKAEQLRESREVLEQVARDLEVEKRRSVKAKQQKARAMQEILEATAAERRLAEERVKKEQEEDLRILKLSVQLEKEAAERARQERLNLLSLHQSRADKIAMLAAVDKKEIATQNAIKREAADQARKDAQEKEEAARKKAEQLKIQEFLKVQQQEKALQKEKEKQERYELQRQQELDAKAYKEQREQAQRTRREAIKRQQELLIKQMEERRLRKDLMVSQTEMKLNRRLLQEVNDYLLRRSQAATLVSPKGS